MWGQKYAPDNKTLTSCRFSIAQVENTHCGSEFWRLRMLPKQPEPNSLRKQQPRQLLLWHAHRHLQVQSTAGVTFYTEAFLLDHFQQGHAVLFFSPPVAVSKKISQNDQVLWALILLRKQHHEGITQRLILFSTNFLQPIIFPPFCSSRWAS